MTDASESQTICNLFIEGSHHLNISVFYLMQNAFYKSKHNRSMQINASYLILFKNPRNNVQPAILARDMFPTRWKAFMDKYEKATSRPYGYVLIDFKQATPDDNRVVTDIFNINYHKPIVQQQSEPVVQSQQKRVQNMIGESVIPWVSSKNLAKLNKNFLSLLSQLPLHQLKGIMSNITLGQVAALREVIKNVLVGNANLSKEQVNQLRPYKHFLQKFAKTSMKRCELNRHCRAILMTLKAAKSTIEQL